MAYYVFHWIFSALAVLVTAYLVPGIKVSSFPAALFAAIIIGVVNILVWPILMVLTLPLTIVTFGLFLFVLNGLTLKLAAALTPGFSIDGFFPAIVGALVLTLVGWAVRFITTS